MEYERIHKLQSGLLSPSKLRMKVIGSHHKKKTDSSRTSPSRLEDLEIVNCCLLLGMEENGDVKDQVLDDCSKLEEKECMQMQGENGDFNRMLRSLRGDNVRSDSHHKGRSCDDENLDYDSTSSFEFHKERSNPNHAGRLFTRPVPSKWNDAEKWISKKIHFHNQLNRVPINTAMVVPETSNNNNGNKLAVKGVDFCITETQHIMENSCLVSDGSDSTSVQNNVIIGLMDSSTKCSTKCPTENTSGVHAIRSVSMRDMGTEMTPIPSQEPSRTATPEGATTPLRSPISSIPSTPLRADPSPTPTKPYNNESLCSTENRKIDMSDQEVKINIRREIVALGIQLGKMNIAAWASKDEKGKAFAAETHHHLDELREIEFVKRASAWEEAEKSELNARFKRKELEIQAWENRQKIKLEAEMKKAEAKVEQIRACARAKMAKKMRKARQKSEEKHVAAEASKNRHAHKVAAQAEHIRRRGRLPLSSISSSSFISCVWF